MRRKEGVYRRTSYVDAQGKRTTKANGGKRVAARLDMDMDDGRRAAWRHRAIGHRREHFRPALAHQIALARQHRASFGALAYNASKLLAQRVDDEAVNRQARQRLQHLFHHRLHGQRAGARRALHGAGNIVSGALKRA